VMLGDSAHGAAVSSFIEVHAHVIQGNLSLIDKGAMRQTTEVTLLPRFEKNFKARRDESLSKIEEVIVSP
jgi:hypothetical protein